MEKSFVKMLKDFGKEHKKDQVYEIDGETAKSWIDAGLAEASSPAEGLSEAFAKALEAREEALIKAFKDAAKVESKVPSVRVTQDEADKTKSFGQYCQLVYKSMASNTESNTRAEACKALETVYKSTQQVADGTLGGYLVPQEFIEQLIEMPGYPTEFSKRTVRVPITGSGQVMLPALDQSITPDGNGQTSANAGVNVFWSKESDDAQETNAKFRAIEMNPNRLTAYIPVSNHLLRSSPMGVDSIVRRLFQNQVNAKREHSYLLGNGVGKPLGQLHANNPAIQSVTRGTASEINWVDVCKMWQELPASSQASAIWLVGQKAIAGLLQLEDGAGHNVFHPSAQMGVNMKLIDRPVFVSEFLSALGTAKDLALVDPSLYYVAETLQPTISISEHVRFLKDESVFRMDFWADGQPAVNYKPILADGTSTVSPAIYLN